MSSPPVVPPLRHRRSPVATALVLTALALAVPCAASAVVPVQPDGRGLELVSPEDPHGNPFVQTGSQAKVLDDDTVISTGGVMPLQDAPSGVPPTTVYRRSATGWASTWLTAADPDPESGYTLQDATPDLSAAVLFQLPSEIFTAPAERSKPGRLLWRAADGTTAPITTPTTLAASDLAYGGMAADGRAVFFGSSSDLDGQPARRTVYRWTPGGGATALGRTAGDPLQTCSTAPAGDIYPFVLRKSQSTNAVSADGTSTFVAAYENAADGDGGPACPAAVQVFLQRAGQASEAISVPTDPGVPAAPGTPSYFEGATPDARTAYFTSAAPLATDDADGDTDLYRWRAGTGGGGSATVSCVSCATTTGDVTDVTVSRRGDLVFFLAGPDLAVFHDGRVDPVDAGTGPVRGLSADGRHVVYDRSGTLYTATVGAGGVGAPACVSCRPDGTAGQGTADAVSLGEISQSPGAQGASSLRGRLAGVISDDGDVVAFSSPEALAGAPAPTGIHAFRWRRGAGVALVADEVGPLGGVAVSPSGRTVFFASFAALAGARGGAQVLYASRVGGGFPAPVPPTPCSGAGCRDATPAPPDAPVAGSATAPEAPDPAPDPGDLVLPRLSVRSVSPAARAAFARTGRLTLRVTAGGGGTVRARATANLRGHRRTVASASRKAPVTSAARTLTLKLSSAARAGLRRAGRLTVRTTVTLPGALPRTITITLTRKRG